MHNQKKRKTAPVTVHLSGRESALVEAEAKASGLSRSAWIRQAVLARFDEKGGNSQGEIEQVGQAAMLSAQLAIEVLAHLQVMLMPSPGQKPQIEQLRSELYARHFHQPAGEQPHYVCDEVSEDEL